MLWVWLALLSAVLVAVASLINKKLLFHDHALELGASEALVSTIILLFFLPFINLTISWQYYFVIYLMSLMLTTANLFYLKSIRHSELSSTLPLMNLSPLFLLIIAFLFLNERPAFMDLIGLLMLVAGAYTLHASTSKKGVLEPLKSLIKEKSSIHMLFALIIYSIISTMEKGIINEGINFMTALVLLRLFGSINYLFMEWYNHGLNEVISDVKGQWKQLTAAVITTLSSGLLYLAALAQPGALVSLIIPLRRTSTLIGTIAAGKMFHEHNLTIKIVASIIMLIGVIIIAF